MFDRIRRCRSGAGVVTCTPMEPDRRERLRRIPKIDRVLLDPEVAALAGRHGRAPVVEAARRATEALRSRVLEAEDPLPNGDLLAEVREAVRREVEQGSCRTLRRAIN